MSQASISGTFTCVLNQYTIGNDLPYLGTADDSFSLCRFQPIGAVFQSGKGLINQPSSGTVFMGPTDSIIYNAQVSAYDWKTLDSMNLSAPYVVGQTYTLTFVPPT